MREPLNDSKKLIFLADRHRLRRQLYVDSILFLLCLGIGSYYVSSLYFEIDFQERESSTHIKKSPEVRGINKE